jgi:hypothetical protein
MVKRQAKKKQSIGREKEMKAGQKRNFIDDVSLNNIENIIYYPCSSFYQGYLYFYFILSSTFCHSFCWAEMHHKGWLKIVINKAICYCCPVLFSRPFFSTTLFGITALLTFVPWPSKLDDRWA